jgi:hypothetical protein
MAENNLIETGRCVYAKSHLIAGRTNLITGLAANGIIAAIRNIGPAELIVDSLDMWFVTTTPSSAAGAVTFAFYKGVGFTALGGGGARAAEPVPVRKRTNDHRVLNPTLLLGDDTAVQVEVSDTAVLSAVTITAALFDDPLGVLVPVRSNGTTDAIQSWDGQTRWEPRNGIPITLEPDEGVIFTTQQAFPPALVGRFGFCADVRIA